MKVLILSASPRKNSHSRALADVAIEYFQKTFKKKPEILDLNATKVDIFRGFGEKYSPATVKAIEALKEADAVIISTPVYNASFSSVLKNIFEHSNYKSLKGMVVGFIINGGTQKSFENVQTLLTSMMNYFGIFSNPQPVFVYSGDFEGITTKLSNDSIKDRIADLVDSTVELKKKLG